MFTISTEGTSKTTVLCKDGVPIARFYAGRFDQELLEEIATKLNGPVNGAELLTVLTRTMEREQRRYDSGEEAQRFFRANNAFELAALERASA